MGSTLERVLALVLVGIVIGSAATVGGTAVTPVRAESGPTIAADPPPTLDPIGDRSLAENETVTENAAVLYRVNAGGESLPAVDDGPDWSADTAGSPSPYHNGGSKTSDYSGQSISTDGTVPSSTPAAVFETARWDPAGGDEMGWAFPVESGTELRVRLHFVDAYEGTSQPGDRAFDVAIEGETVLDDYDVVADVGPDTGTTKEFTVTSDGTVNVEFGHVTENPIVAGVELVRSEPKPNTLGGTSDVDFGTAVVDDTATETVTLTNRGGDGDPDVTVTDVSVSGPDAAAFTTEFNGSTTLAPGESTDLDVSFSPTEAGSKTATLEVAHSGDNSPYTVALSGEAESSATVSFGSSTLDLGGVGIDSPSSLDFGPDGRLYVSSASSGEIYALTVQRNAENEYAVTDSEVITAVEQTPNHWDNGSLAPGVDGRQVTGILAAGTAQQPVLYVSSSDPRIGGKSAGEDTGLDTNSGVVSRLTWNGSAWNHVHLVRGLPRSEENHAPNGLVLGQDGETLYLTQGSNTGQGAPSNELAYLPEYAYSAAVLSIDLARIESMSTKAAPDGSAGYKYNLPTLQGTAQPWGGQDGRNQAIVTNDSPVRVYAPGFRNTYDLTVTEDGRIYGVDNGGSKGWGGPPVNEGPEGACTNQPNDGGDNQNDQLHLITEGFYGGHPNPTRGNPDGAGVYDEEGNRVVEFNASHTPVPFEMAQARQCDLLTPGSEDGALTTFSDSTNGITEYTASNFGGKMRGDLLTVSFTSGSTVWRLGLDDTGESIVSKTSQFSNFGSFPLDITAQGDDGVFPGTVWVANYGGGTITAFEPSDYGGGSGGEQCTGADDPVLDEDDDGYDNADEFDAGTDPCSAADKPADFDGDGTSDLNDPDDDNDGRADTDDPFAVDADDGLGTDLPVRYDFEAASQPGTLFDAGFTGVMVNGSDYRSLYNETNVTAAGIAGVLSVDNPTGDPATDNQTYGFQFGVDTPAEPFTVHTRVENAFVDDPTTDDYQSTGVFLGPGTQDDYVELSTTADDGDVTLVLAREDGSTHRTVAAESLGNASDLGQSFELYLRVDPANGTVTAEYSLDGGATVATVGETSVDPAWLNDERQGLGVGVLGTHRGASYQATWDALEVERTRNQAPTVDALTDQSLDEGEGRTTEVSATDPDADPLTLSASDLPSFATFADDGDGTGTLTFAPEEGDVGVYNLTVTASDGTLSDSQSVSVTVTENATVLYRVNAGGESLPAVGDGPDWSADTAGSPSPYHNGGSDVSDYSDQSIAVDDSVSVSTPPAVFESTRWDPTGGDEMGWAFPVDAGTSVTVRLYFVDAWSGTDQPGDRVFDVAIEGETKLDDYDVVADAGPDAGTTKEFTVTSDGTLNVEFGHVTQNPIVAGVELVEANGTETNVAPEVDPIADRSITEGDTATVGVTATDPNGDQLDLSASGLPSFASFADDGDGTGTLTFAPEAGDAGTYETTLTASDGSLSDSETVSVTVTENATVLYRVNAGGGSLSAIGNGPDWSVDTAGSPSPYHDGGSKTSDYSDQSISIDGTVSSSTPAAVFETARWDPTGGGEMGWAFPVENGTRVEVRLHLVDAYEGTSQPGDRVFDVAIENGTVLDDYDVVANVGPDTGTTERFIVTSDGTVNVEFGHVTQNPIVAGVELVRVEGNASDTTTASAD